VIAAVSALLALATLAAAEAPPPAAVMIQRADDDEEVVLEASLRLKSELAVAGYTGQIVACTIDPAKGPVDCPQKEAQDSISLTRVEGASSIFATSVLPGGRRWQRWLRVPDADGGNDATLLAVRAVELLKDVQLHLATSNVDPEEPTPLEPFAQAPPPRPSGWVFAAGFSALTTPWRTQVPFFPVLGANLGAGRLLGSRMLVMIQACGPYLTYLPIATESSQPGPQDRPFFQVQALASARASWSSPRTGPFAAMRLGLRFMHVQLGAANLNGPSDSAVLAMAGVGVGWALPLSRRVFTSLEVHLDISPSVQVVDNTQPTPIVLDATGPWSGGLELTLAIAEP
jgi:hypothetical protein